MGMCVCGWVYERENVLGRESASCVTKKAREREKEREKERERERNCVSAKTGITFHFTSKRTN